MMTFIFILLAILVYVAICLIVMKDVETRMTRYDKETVWKEGIVDNALVTKLTDNE